MGERAEFKKLRALTDAIRRNPERGLAALRDGANQVYGTFRVGDVGGLGGPVSFLVVTTDHPGMRVDVLLWENRPFIDREWCEITLHIRYAQTLPDNVKNTPKNSPLQESPSCSCRSSICANTVTVTLLWRCTFSERRSTPFQSSESFPTQRASSCTMATPYITRPTWPTSRTRRSMRQW